MKDQLLRRASQLLDRLEKTLGKPGDLQSTLQHILQTAQSFFKVDGSIIVAINPISGLFMDGLMLTSEQEIEPLPVQQTRPQELTQKVVERGLLFIQDLANESDDYQYFFTREYGHRSYVGLALHEHDQQKVLGVLYLNFMQPQTFSKNDRELFQFFAEQTSYILHETWLVQRYRQVAYLGQQINQELSTVDALFQKLHTHVNTILDTSLLFQLAVYQPHTNAVKNYLSEHDTVSPPPTSLPLQANERTILAAGETMIIPDLSMYEQRLPFQVPSAQSGADTGSMIVVPLTLQGLFLGALLTRNQQVNGYNHEDQFILELLANHIALALYNIRLYESLTLLNNTGQVLTQQLESEQVLQITVNQICEVTQADNVILYPYQASLRRFVFPPRVGGQLLDEAALNANSLHPQDIAVRALEFGQPLFATTSEEIYATLHSPQQPAESTFQQREQLRSTAVLPLTVGDLPVGVLFINYRSPQYFDIPQRFLIESLAHYAAIAIKNAQTFSTVMERRIRELEILQEIEIELSRHVELDEVLETILRLGHEHVPAEEAAILFYEPHLRILEPRAVRSRDPAASMAHSISIEESRGITSWVVNHKMSALVLDVHARPWSEYYLQVDADTLSELDVPMIHDNQVIGVLNFESTRVGAFTHDDEVFLTTLAGQAVLAINKSQAFERERRLAEEGYVLNEISREITSQLDINHVFDLILSNALRLTESHTGTLMLYENNALWMAAERGVTEDHKDEQHNLDEGVVGHVALHKSLLNIDPSQPPWSEIYLSYIPGTRSELAVPMLAGDTLLGVLNVESRKAHQFKESDERLLTALAGMACVALQNARAYEREKRLAEESQVLYDISREIAGQFDSDNVFRLILEKALDVTHALTGSLYLYDVDLHDLHRVAEYDVHRVAKEGKKRQKLNSGIVGFAASTREYCNVKDTRQSPWREMFIERVPGVRSELAVPMLEGHDLRGVLNVESREPGHFRESDVRLLQGLAALAVVAQQNAERYKKAEREAHHFELLYRAGRDLGRIVEWEQLEEAYDHVMQIAHEHSRCYVTLRNYDENRQILVLTRATHYRHEPQWNTLELTDGLHGLVAHERQTRVIFDRHSPSIDVRLHMSDPAFRCLVVTPVHFKDRYYGNLALEHEEIGYFRDTEIHFFEGLATQLASTIHRLETIKARQELEQMSSIGQSAFEVTHRLDNDLGLVGLYINDIQAEVAQKGLQSNVISERLNDIIQSVQAVLTFSRNLKYELAKLRDKEGAADFRDFFPQELLDAALKDVAVPTTIRVMHEKAAIHLKVRAVYAQVVDILHNLVTNAIQAMPDGGKLTLRTFVLGRMVYIEVADTGIGIPAHKQKQIFELFFSTKGSSGFGLWSARRNALKNQGDLRVESMPGAGTTFTLILPSSSDYTR